MSTTTTISWATKTWNPTVGCSRDEDPGCDGCYAMFVANRGMCEAHRGLTIIRPKGAKRPGVDWNGTVRQLPDRLDEPTRWRKPERVFVNSMSDLFHRRVRFDFVERVWDVMQASEQHTFLVLTKRVARAVDFSLTRSSIRGELPNVQLGFSASCQWVWDKKAPIFEQARAAVRWVSLEPLLGPVDLSAHLHALDWVVVGGESGSKARPCDVAWIRDIVRQCRDRAVPVFVKQLGAKPCASDSPTMHQLLRVTDRKGEDMDEWPENLRVRQYPRSAA